MLKEFIKYILPEIRKFPKVFVDHSYLTRIDEAIFRHYGVDNITNLRDQFDAANYYEEYRLRAVSEAAIEKVIGIGFINWEDKEHVRNHKAILNLKGIEIEILGVEYGQLPVIYSDTKENIIICILRGRREVMIAGYINLNSNEIKLKPLLNSPVTRSNLKRGTFCSFDKIRPFNNCSELDSLIDLK